ncbi:MAG: OmpA family protein [Saprospiraceae bacterium]|nr:OmpA family protein [Saprospiraceae bacterium]
MKILFFILSIFIVLPSAVSQYHGVDDNGKPYIVKSIFFRGGSYYIDEEQKIEVLKFLDEQILENYEIHIHSHTDPIGGKEYNEWLSKMRSLSAYRMLEIEGFMMDHIYIKDHDFENPEFDNNTWQGRLKNRRVDIVLWPLPA